MGKQNSISIYIHIPFCSSICSYCDFSKIFYNQRIVNEYLLKLKDEITQNYKGENVKTIYVGGGTPSSLSLCELKELLEITRLFKKNKDCEFTFECNPENLNEEKIVLLKKYGVNRVSIGVQSFNKNILTILNRKHTSDDVVSIIEKLKNNGINNINIDLIFGIKTQNLNHIKKDLEEFTKLDIPHISYYSLILEEHTKLHINNYEEIDEDIVASQYDYICDYLKKSGLEHYEISNFSKSDYKSIHNLTYWNNEYYYGFGLGAHGYINNIRYENTRSITKYLNEEYRLLNNNISKKENMENEVMLGLRKLKGINKKSFYKKFGENINDVFNLKYLINKGLLKEVNNSIFIPEKYLFISNAILTEMFMDGDFDDRK